MGEIRDADVLTVGACARHQLAGPACSIKVAESRAFGIRLELRLNQMPTDEVSIVVQVEVVADSDQSAAA